MKRKKWSEREELTLLSKYSDLLNSGALSKLKTREKKFRPIADHVNAVHHLHDPVTFPFKWSWRDVSIKVQNMRHQYLGVKQKIKVSNDEFNWRDGENHWENFMKYKEVFGDVELEVRGGKRGGSETICGDLFEDCWVDVEEEEMEVVVEEEEEEEEGSCEGRMESGSEFEVKRRGKVKRGVGRSRGLGLLGAQVLDLRDVVVRREEKRREREEEREKSLVESVVEKRRRKEGMERNAKEEEEEEEEVVEERGMRWGRREYERRVRLESELKEERRRRMRMEEKREEEEMEWRERMVGLQVEHEKAMMQMQADACQNQLQILGVMARLVCQFFGGANDGLGGGLGALPPQVLQNLQQHPGGLGDDNGKPPDANSPSEFL